MLNVNPTYNATRAYEKATENWVILFPSVNVGKQPFKEAQYRVEQAAQAQLVWGFFGIYPEKGRL